MGKLLGGGEIAGQNAHLGQVQQRLAGQRRMAKVRIDNAQSLTGEGNPALFQQLDGAVYTQPQRQGRDGGRGVQTHSSARK